MDKRLRRWLTSFILLALVIGLTACGQGNAEKAGKETGKPTIKIGYLPITHAAPLYIEDELGKGKFQHFQLELVKFGSWPDLMDALNTGKIDGASVLVQLAMKAKEQGIDLKAVALGHRDGNVIVTANDIHSVNDLKGKNFAIPHKFSTHNILLYQMLKQEGLQYTDVNVIELPPAEMPAALAEGRIAGYVVAEPFGAKSVVIEKGKAFLQSEELWKDSVDCALVVRGELIRDNRAAAEEFITEYAKAGEKAESKDEQVKSILSAYMNVEEKVLDLSLQWIAYDHLRLDEEAYEKLRQYLIEMGLSEKPPTFAEFVDNSFMDKAK
ncbi:ABC transporter substrate-binding protein [Brevibacillus composti]|uniref:ABC transporter substrate-binding protein n=1 Tax=Brevibacillus composti TaxID=2796470 RepID=A0A7T5JNR3_9BACL|nr:ABC transporter substrate-binding protein [Brevibacillus composti]QQE74357.1 ABC transporter substrate-binding protein [Brevibacillus composti]QUO41439.1 ABC transporter substrate-binding protein [Brevibacillus composti]